MQTLFLQMLTTNVSLKTVHICNCNIGDAGAFAIADALKANRSLDFIDLSFNPFTCNFITNGIAPMLEINTTLKKLWSCNRSLDSAAAGDTVMVMIMPRDDELK